MSMFDDEIRKYREKIDLQDGRLKQLLLEEGVHRDTLADDRKSDVWPAARERLDSIQSEMPREQAVLDQAQQDLQNVYAVRDAVDRALAAGSPDLHREEKGPLDHQVVDQSSERVVTWEQADAVAQTLQEISDPPVMVGQERIDAVPDALLAAAMVVSVAGRSVKTEWAAYQERRAPVELQATQEADTLANQLEARQRAELTEMKGVVASEWNMAQTDLAAYGLTPDAPGDYYKNLFDQQVQRVQQTHHLHDQQWVQQGLEAERELRSSSLRGDVGLSQLVCEQYAARAIGVLRVEKPVVDYERVLHERNVEDTADRLAAYRKTLEESAQPDIAVRAEELHAQHFLDLDRGVVPPSREVSERAALGPDAAPSAPDFVSRDSPEFDR